MIKYIFEIKFRLFLLIYSSFLFLLVSYYYSKFFLILIIFVNAELVENNILNYFIFTSITDLFLTHLKLSIYLTNYLIFFVVVYHFICFIKPGLYRKEFFKIKKFFFMNIIVSTFSLILCHVILLPLMSKFFLGFNLVKNSYIDFYFEANIYNYFIFYKQIVFNCFLNFQVFILFSTSFNYFIYDFKNLKRLRKFIYLFLLIISTLSTPPDLISQIIAFFSVCFLFELSIFINITKKVSNKF